jgi:ribosome-associated protein
MNSDDAGSPQTVTIAAEPIELCQLLKFAGLTASGGEAKQVIAAGLVAVNGEIETRKRRKMVAGDRATFDGRTLVVALAG